MYATMGRAERRSMIEQCIIDKILRGEPVHIVVSGKSNENVLDFQSWLQGFKHVCDARLLINCNSIVSQNGSERLDISIGPIPHSHREHLASTLSNLSRHTAPDSPLVIEEAREP
jgi:hypothetical protein